MAGLSIGIGVSVAAQIIFSDENLPAALTLDASTAEIETTETTVTITITGSPGGIYDGVYTVNVADLAAGPVNLVPARITGTAQTGQVLTVIPGVWVHDGSNATPALSYVWQQDGANIAGAAGTTYTLQTADAGTSITCVETAAGVNGTRVLASGAIAIPAAPATQSHTDTFDQTDGSVLQDEAGYSGYGAWSGTLTAHAGAVGFQSAGGYSGGVHYNGGIGPDQSCQFKLRQFGVTTAVNMEAQGVVRATGSSNGYRLTVLFRAGQPAILRLKKGTSILAANVLGTISADDEFSIKAVGSTVTVEHLPSGGTWTEVWSGTDTDYTDGDPGLFLSVATTATSVPLFEYATYAEAS